MLYLISFFKDNFPLRINNIYLFKNKKVSPDITIDFNTDNNNIKRERLNINNIENNKKMEIATLEKRILNESKTVVTTLIELNKLEQVIRGKSCQLKKTKTHYSNDDIMNMTNTNVYEDIYKIKVDLNKEILLLKRRYNSMNNELELLYQKIKNDYDNICDIKEKMNRNGGNITPSNISSNSLPFM